MMASLGIFFNLKDAGPLSIPQFSLTAFFLVEKNLRFRYK